MSHRQSVRFVYFDIADPKARESGASQTGVVRVGVPASALEKAAQARALDAPIPIAFLIASTILQALGANNIEMGITVQLNVGTDTFILPEVRVKASDIGDISVKIASVLAAAAGAVGGKVGSGDQAGLLAAAAALTAMASTSPFTP